MKHDIIYVNPDSHSSNKPMNKPIIVSHLLQSTKLHWTVVFAFGGTLGAWPLLGGDWVPHNAAVGLALGLIMLIVTAAICFRFTAKRFGLAPEVWVFSPLGLLLPREMQLLVPAKRTGLACIIPIVYAVAGLITLPHLIRAGGAEGVFAAWDWWTGPMIAARFSLASLALALFYLLPVYPLAGAYVIKVLLGRFTSSALSHTITCRIGQFAALGIILLYITHPWMAVAALYFLVTAELERRSYQETQLRVSGTDSDNTRTGKSPLPD
jgi:hypothetical protein